MGMGRGPSRAVQSSAESSHDKNNGCGGGLAMLHSGTGWASASGASPGLPPPMMINDQA